MSPGDTGAIGVVVIGVGNTFRRDDGAGPAVVSGLAATTAAVPGPVRLAVCDGEPTRLIDLWDGAALAVIVDAAPADPRAGLVPGDLVWWEWDPQTSALLAAGHGAGSGEPVARFSASPSAGTHALGPGSALSLAGVLDRLPSRLLMLAVVGADFAEGPGLSEQVAAAVPSAVALIAAELRNRRGGPVRPVPWTTCSG